MANFLRQEIFDQALSCFIDGMSVRQVSIHCKISKTTATKIFEFLVKHDAETKKGRWVIEKGKQARFIPNT